MEPQNDQLESKHMDHQGWILVDQSIYESGHAVHRDEESLTCCKFSPWVLNATAQTFNPLSPKNDENEISFCIITTCSNIQMMRIKELITKDKMSWYLGKFSLLVP